MHEPAQQPTIPRAIWHHGNTLPKQQFDTAALQQRALRLVQRFQEHSQSAANAASSELGEALIPHTQSLPNDQDSVQDFTRKVSQLIGQITPLRARFHELQHSASLADQPVERARLAKGRQLIELLDRMIRESRPSANQQIAMLPAWESMLEHAIDIHADLANKARWFQRRAAQCATLRELYCQLLAGGRIRLEAATELAGRILHDVDELPQPEILQPTHFEPAALVSTHAVNVAHVAGFLASSDPEWKSHRAGVVVSALFMDIGMLKTAPDVLRSSRPLDDLRRADVERHPLDSKTLAERILGVDETILLAIAAHHEREDGGGYVAGASGPEIPPTAKLLAIADTYVAMRSRRAHRPAYEPQHAFTTTLAEAEAGRLDQSLARQLLAISMYPIGTAVELATGELAEVVAPQNALDDPPLAALPIVRLLIDAQGATVPTPIFRNLATRPDSRILRTVTRDEVFSRKMP